MPTPSSSVLSRFFFSSPHGRAILLFVAAWLSAALYLRPSSIRDPSSAFFNPDIAFQRSYSLIREDQANEYITTHNSSSPYTPTKSTQSLCVGIPTVQRAGARYLKTTVGAVLDGLTDAERRDIILLPFIAQTDPARHLAFKEPWVHNLPDALLTYHLPPDKWKYVKRLERADTEHMEKSRFDYIYALTACYNTSAPYILMLEDDVLAVRGWYTRLREALAQLELRAAADSTLYVRLFYTEIFLGWNGEEWPVYLAWSAAWETALAFILLALRRRHGAAARFLTPATILACLAVASPLTVALYFAAGRITVQPFPVGLHPMNNFGCCSQALLFPRARVPDLAAFVSSRRAGPVDSAIELYANRFGWARWALSPALFQHIGGQSSKINGQEKNGFWGRAKAEVLWNFRYEGYHWDHAGERLIG